LFFQLQPLLLSSPISDVPWLLSQVKSAQGLTSPEEQLQAIEELVYWQVVRLFLVIGLFMKKTIALQIFYRGETIHVPKMFCFQLISPPFANVSPLTTIAVPPSLHLRPRTTTTTTTTTSSSSCLPCLLPLLQHVAIL